jgi:hypothetical protein
MKQRLLLLLLACAMAGSGCIYHKDGGSPFDPSDPSSPDPLSEGNTLTLSWSFAGFSCAQAGVATVVVTMPGQTLQNAGRYSCSNSGFEGITLTQFTYGTYAYELDGYDAAGTLRYRATGQVDVNVVDTWQLVDLLSVDVGTPPPGVSDAGTGSWGGGGHDAGTGGVPDSGSWGGGYDAGSTGGGGYDAGSGGGTTGGGGTCGCHMDAGVDAGTVEHALSWSFPVVSNAPTCGDELAQVVLTIDGVAVNHECGAGLWPSRVTLPTLSAGQHTLEIDAVDSSGRAWASHVGTLSISSTNSSYDTIEVPWIVGSAAVRWSFYSCDGLQAYASCSQAGVDTVAINFEDSSGAWLYADAHNYPLDQDYSCDATNGSTVMRAVTPGQYDLWVGAYGPRGTDISYAESPDSSMTPISVQAGVFFTATSPSSDFVSVNLWQQ